MKKIAGLLVIVLFVISLAGCATNEKTGSILVQNITTKSFNNVKVGNTFIGYVGPGQNITVYFFSEESGAKISIEGAVPSGLTKQGIIDLKLNYSYNLYIMSSNDKIVYSMSGQKIDASEYVNYQ